MNKHIAFIDLNNIIEEKGLVIKIFGPDSITIVNRILRNKNIYQLNESTLNIDYIIDKNNHIIDKVIISFNSLPIKNTVEIYCYNGLLTITKIIEILKKYQIELITEYEALLKELNNLKTNNKIEVISQLQDKYNNIKENKKIKFSKKTITKTKKFIN